MWEQARCRAEAHLISPGVVEATIHRRNFICNDGDCHHHFFKVEFAIFQAILSFTILQFYAQRCNCKLTSWQALPTVNSASVICRKCDSGRGSAPDPAWGAYDAPTDPLVGWGANTPPHTPPHSAPLAPRCSRLRRPDRRAPLAPNPGDATGHHHFLR